MKLHMVSVGCIAPAREWLRVTPVPPKDWSQHLAGDTLGTVPLLPVVRNMDGKEDKLASTC